MPYSLSLALCPLLYKHFTDISALIISSISSSAKSTAEISTNELQIKKEEETEIKRTKMNWISRKMHLYNVTMGLYMLDWWERCLFNMLLLTLLWFICYNGSRFATELYDAQYLQSKFLVNANFPIGGAKPT